MVRPEKRIGTASASGEFRVQGGLRCTCLFHFLAGLGVVLAPSPSVGVPIDLSDNAARVIGPTRLELQGVAANGHEFWARFDWNEGRNSFDVTAFGEMLHYDFVGSEAPEGAAKSWFMALNDHGAMVQWAEFEDSPGGFRDEINLYEDGVLTDIGGLGGSDIIACRMNNSNGVVGSSQLPGDEVAHAFVYQEGRMTDLGTLGGANSRATAIDDAGIIAGGSEIGDGVLEHVFIVDDGVMRDLGAVPEEAGFVYAADINETGTLVGM